MPDTTRPTPTTREAERAEAEAHAQPDRMPTPDEEEKAEENTLDPEVSEHEREMLERGREPEGRGPTALRVRLSGSSKRVFKPVMVKILRTAS